ncbi:DUF7266 family protein [Halopiger aswanensis]|uniref:Uncharacterized protein n=1 Tax=Halopiger aswanensis TaxID=148449 RepID=A0A419WR17_9EURY|nr:hypothetical protein [Halopiger aswanensis]RKD97857.1 hypothetical protein ATJ93_0854 [Halopiger aswanensis]
MIEQRPSDERNREQDRHRDRGVSIAITHVLTIGITTILIAMLLMSGSSLLESETDRSVETSLETVGERLADEIANVDRIASRNGTETVNLTVDHPRTVSNSGYTVELLNDASEAPLIEDGPCLRLTARSTDVVVYVPVAVDADLDGSATGGTIEISADGNGTITIEEVSG